MTGGLYNITGTGFQPAAINLGFAPGQNLPDLLGSVQVSFDGVQAPILAVAPGSVIVAAPPPPPERLGARRAPGYTAVQLTWNGEASNLVCMRLQPPSSLPLPLQPASSLPLPGLLTHSFPALPPTPEFDTPDAYAFNQDGTMNDEQHPAPIGSIVYIYATSLGPASPPLAPGTVSQIVAVPAVKIWSTWDLETSKPDNQPPPLTVTTMPGYVSDLFQVQVPVPAGIDKFSTPDANGVVRYPLGLMFRLDYDQVPISVSNWVSVYLTRRSRNQTGRLYYDA